MSCKSINYTSYQNRTKQIVIMPYNFAGEDKKKITDPGACFASSFKFILKVTCNIFFIILVSTVMVHFMINYIDDHTKPVHGTCRLSLVESLPDGLEYEKGSIQLNSTYEAWSKCIDLAQERVDIVAFYWTLKNDDVSSQKFESSWKGEEIFKKIVDAGKNRGIKIKIVQNFQGDKATSDSEILKREAHAEVYNLDFKKLLGGGVLHTKMILVDQKYFYVGSANMDFRALTQVKELGFYGEECSPMTSDLRKIFDTLIYIASGNEIPDIYPNSFTAQSNMLVPMQLDLKERGSAEAFISSSPKAMNARRRTNDINAILHHIESAEKFVYVAVMDYFPSSLYRKDQIFWPEIDDALRRAAFERGVHVRVLASHWNHTRPYMVNWLRSLQDLSSKDVSIQAKLFVVPAFTEEQREIPFSRVNHNKYMVTDKTAYIGTSNWSEDYFMTTGGIGISVSDEKNGTNTVRSELEAIHSRDWNSRYAKPLSDFIN